MNFFKFQINTIVFLVVILATVLIWTGLEIYHRQSDLDIDPILTQQATTPLDASFDSDTLNKIYSSKDKYYESITPTPTTR